MGSILIENVRGLKTTLIARGRLLRTPLLIQQKVNDLRYYLTCLFEHCKHFRTEHSHENWPAQSQYKICLDKKILLTDFHQVWREINTMKGDLFKVGIKSVTTESCNLFQPTFSRSPTRQNHERRPVQSGHQISQDAI